MSDTSARPVRASDRVSDVLARDERLVEVFARQSPHFARLRNPGMRRVMARLVSVEQAARICGAEPSALVRELNRALGVDDALPHTADDAAGSMRDHQHALPPGLRPVELDVREDLRQGREPFSRIMAAVGALRADEALCLRATFEPVPLFAVMQKRGFQHLSEQVDADDWRVWFYRGGVRTTPEQEPPASAPGELSAGGATGEPESSANPAFMPVCGAAEEIVLDVRGMEPPEPMQRTLEAAERLQADMVLVHINVRVPHFLLPVLDERGFDYEIFQPSPDRVVVRIWRAAPGTPTQESPTG
ncbi:MAG TPA: DUF2249 domain-containing protein [Gemmatimonadaceae bacterium]|nr:DUF2249 domain-containing protein [Gemmatimonadaceae bacterium]